MELGTFLHHTVKLQFIKPAQELYSQLGEHLLGIVLSCDTPSGATHDWRDWGPGHWFGLSAFTENGIPESDQVRMPALEASIAGKWQPWRKSLQGSFKRDGILSCSTSLDLFTWGEGRLS